MLFIQALFMAATYSVSDLIKTFYIRTIKADSERTFAFYPPLERFTPPLLYLSKVRRYFRSDPNHLMWKEQRHRAFGRCHSAYPGKKLKNLMIYYAKLTLYVFGIIKN